jgi:SOS-response transcriptional repressor LexA
MADFPRLLSGRFVLPPLSEKQEEVLRWLITYSEKNGYFPVLRETAAQFELSLARVQVLMQQLEKRGYIVKTMTRSRNVQLTELTKSWFERQLEKEKDSQQQPGFENP